MKSFIAVKPLSIPDVIEENIQDIDRCSTVTQATSCTCIVYERINTGFLIMLKIIQSFGDLLMSYFSGNYQSLTNIKFYGENRRFFPEIIVHFIFCQSFLHRLVPILKISW